MIYWKLITILLYKTIKSEDSLTINKSQFEKIKNIANNVKLSDLTKIWQMLLKGPKELSISRVGQKLLFTC